MLSRCVCLDILRRSSYHAERQVEGLRVRTDLAAG